MKRLLTLLFLPLVLSSLGCGVNGTPQSTFPSKVIDQTKFKLPVVEDGFINQASNPHRLKFWVDSGKPKDIVNVKGTSLTEEELAKEIKAFLAKSFWKAKYQGIKSPYNYEDLTVNPPFLELHASKDLTISEFLAIRDRLRDAFSGDFYLVAKDAKGKERVLVIEANPIAPSDRVSPVDLMPAIQASVKVKDGKPYEYSFGLTKSSDYHDFAKEYHSILEQGNPEEYSLDLEIDLSLKLQNLSELLAFYSVIPEDKKYKVDSQPVLSIVPAGKEQDEQLEDSRF